MIEQIKKIVIALIAISQFIGCLAITLYHLNPKPTIEDNINQKLEEAENNPLTDKERELATESQTKEWEEVDKETDKQQYDYYKLIQKATY